MTKPRPLYPEPPPIEEIRRQLVAHLAKRPELPRPFIADSPAAKTFQATFTPWAVEKDRLEYLLRRNAVVDSVRYNFVRTVPAPRTNP